MTAPLRRVRRTLALVLVASLGGVGAIVATTAAQAVPVAPIIQAPLDDTQGFFSISVVPAPHPLEQTVNVYYRAVGAAVDTLGCTVVVPANTPDGDIFPCDVTVPPGAYGFYTAFAIATDVDGDSAASDPLSSLRYGGAADPGSIVLGTPLNGPGDPIDLFSEGGAFTVTGQGPALGSVDLFGYPLALGPGASQFLGGAGVDVTGNFSIPATVPTFGDWEVRVLATDIEGTSIDEPFNEATISLRVVPASPTVTVTPLEGALGVSVASISPLTVGAALTIDAYTGGSDVRPCPASWDGTLGNPSAVGPVATCTLTTIPPGVHQLDSVQWAGAVAGPIHETAVYIPGTPTLTVDVIPGGAIYSGTIDRQTSALSASGTQIVENQIEVLDSTDDVRCFAAVSPDTGAWSCTSEEPPGAETFTAIARSFGFSDGPSASNGADAFAGGVSSRATPVVAVVPAGSTPPPPTMTYRLGAASIGVQAAGVPNSAVAVRLYQVEEVDGDGYVYGDPVDECGLPEPVPDGPVGSPNGAPPTAPSFVDDCEFDGLAPGIWNVFSWQSLYFEDSANRDHYVLIPDAPTVNASFSSGGVLVSGQGSPGYRALVREVGGSAGCAATVASNGTWSCSVSGVSGLVRLRAQQQSQGFVATPPFGFGSVASFDGYSAFTAPVSIFVPTASATTPQALSWVLNGITGAPLAPGQVLDLSAEGLPPETVVVVEIRSTPQVLGSTIADDLGVMALSVTIPLDIEAGEHTLVATATPPGGEPSVVSVPVTVAGTTPVAAPDSETAQQDGSEGAAAAGGAGAVDRSNPAAPSVLTDSIPTVQRIFNDPWVALGSGGLALAILLLVAFPAELLNSTLSSNTGRLGRWIVALEQRAERVTEWFARISRTRAAAAALLVGITSVIFGFVDPNYGFDPVSARTTLSLAIGLFLITYGAAWITGTIASRVWGVETKVSLEPVALLFAVVGVIVARLLEFSPGFLIGLVIGLDLVSRVDAAVRARVVVLSTGIVASVAVSAWIVYSVLTAVSTGEPGWIELLIHDALVATTAEGLTAALASLLPLGFLAGHDVFRHSKPLWGGTFLVIAALFALIVLPTAQGGTASVADMTFWILVMVVFAVVTLAIWGVLQFTGRSDDHEGEGAADAREAAVSAGADR